LISGLLGISDLKPAETAVLSAALKERSAKKIELELGHALSRRAGIGWVFTGHGGDDVTLYCLHPRDLRIGGVIQNTDMALYTARLLGTNLGIVTGRLFAPAGREFAAAGAAVSIDAADPDNPVFQAVKGGHTLRLAVNKNLADLDGRIIPLEGVVVCTAAFPGPAVMDPNSWFAPRAAADLLK
jgi:alkaline phosphatase